MRLLRKSLLISALLIPFCPAYASDMAYPQSGCQLLVPDSWKLNHPPSTDEAATVAVSPEHNKAIRLFIQPINVPGPLNDDSAFVQGFTKAFHDHGIAITSHQLQTRNGKDFYVLASTQKSGTMTINTTCWMIVANGHVFQISLDLRDGDPAKDAELMAALDSFAATSAK